MKIEIKQTRALYISLLLLFTACSSARKTASIEDHELPLSLSARLEYFHPQREDFFYSPKASSRAPSTKPDSCIIGKCTKNRLGPQAEHFKGYILYADPYHRALKKISFLLGSDCSNLVHRIYQMMGAPFHYIKTRHWISIARAKRLSIDEKNLLRKTDFYSKQNRGSTPIDLKRCEWDDLLSKFDLVEDQSNLQLGDVVVYPKSEGILGTKGHMGYISKTTPPFVMQSKYPRGIVELPLEASEVFILRWKGSIQPLQTSSFSALFEKEYPENISACKSSSEEETH